MITSHISEHHIVHLNYILLFVKKRKKNIPQSIGEINSIIFIKQREPHFPKASLVKISKHLGEK